MRPINDIFEDPAQFDFFHTLRRLEKWHANQPRISESATTREEYVALGQDPFLIFPDANISKATRNSDGRMKLLVRFMGLLGPQGALPLATTEEAYGYLFQNDDAFARFLDLLNNRFIQLFFRAWANSRPIVQRDRPEQDQFEKYVGSGIGLGSPRLRNLDSVPDMVKVGYAGLMGAKAKSAVRLRDLLRGVFGMRTEIEEFVGSRLTFEPDQRSRLGVGFMTVGENLLLGDGVYSVQDKIRIRLYAATLEDYRTMLPSGKRAKKLADLVFFYLGAEIEWDVELALPVGEVEPVKLGVAGQLGWTTWMAPNWAAEKGAMRTDARFDLTKRFQTA
jgi:type VI secretion system protein ImpH